MKRAVATLAGVAALASIPAVVDGKDGPRASSGMRALNSEAPAAILEAVNTERQLAGIDPVSARGDLADSCTAHAGYMRGNDLLTHDESPGREGYSAQGAWAGEHAVLARNSGGFFTDPWKEAPFHEFQVLHPWLRSTGIGVAGTYACMVTLGDRDAPAPAEIKLLTVPGFGQYARPAEVAREAPFVPGDEVGLPQGTKTGPHIYVYAVGPEHFDTVEIQSASLTPSDGTGAVPLKWVDGTSPRSGKYLDGGAIIIPAVPLSEGVSYALRVEAATTTAAGQRLLISRTTSFITGPDEEGLYPESEENDSVTAAGAREAGLPARGTTILGRGAGAPLLAATLTWSHRGVTAHLTCQSEAAPCVGPLRVLVRRKGGRVQKLRFVAGPGPLRIKLAAGRTMKRRITMTRRQHASGRRRGFAIRFGGGDPLPAKAYRAR